MANCKAFDIDGIDLDDDGEEELGDLIDGAAQRSEVSPLRVFVPADVLDAYNGYMRDFRERMATWRAIERQQMGRQSRGFPGERCA
jgi:hypothetical protein